MKNENGPDRDLGMHRPITRRDFVQGTGALLGGALAGNGPATASNSEPSRSTSVSYPPALKGLRGSDPASYRVAHRLARSGQRDFGPISQPDTTLYDLVVVGGGLSGLAAAQFFRERHPDARILILENHDDFGGHARRNEFQIGDRTLIGYGGSQSLEDPHDYPPATRQLIDGLGIDLSKFETAYDRTFYRRHGLEIGVYFDPTQYSANCWVPYPIANPLDDNEFAPTKLNATQAVSQMPISPEARRDLLRVLVPHLEGLGPETPLSKLAFLSSLTYSDFLEKYLGVRNPEVIRILNATAVSNFSDSIDAIPAWSAISWGGLPGLPHRLIERLLATEDYEAEPYIYHFPDGNASIARLLVRSLIPEAASGQTMDDIVMARFDYDRLDHRDSDIRLRLESTVTQVKHSGPLDTAKDLTVTYVRNGRAERIQAKHCVLACYNMMIPYLCPELSTSQGQALSSLVKAPLLYTNVLLRNWRSFKAKGIGWAFCPGLDHQVATLDFPVSLGNYRFSASPDDPILLHLEGSPLVPDSGLTPRKQYRAARSHMLATPFEALERSIRGQLTGLLSGTEFDPARDIAGITVNRWGHGYAYGYNPLSDPADVFAGDHSKPHVRGRPRFGRIAIANSDAGASPNLPSAIEQAKRAVDELVG